MRLGLYSTMAALLTCNGLALGQAPDIVISGQPPVEYGQPASRGLFGNRRGGEVIQTQATTVTPLPMPAAGATPVVTPVPAGAVMPTVETVAAEPRMIGNATDYHSDDRLWFRADYLLWRLGSIPLPPFQANVSAGTAIVFSRTQTITNNVPAAPVDTQINLPINVTTSVGLPGGQDQDLRDQPGVRLEGGMWLDAEQEWGIDVGAFWLVKRDVGFTSGLNLVGQTIQLDESFNQNLTISTIAANNQTQQVINTPLFVAADVNTQVIGRVSNEAWGAEFNGRKRVAWFGPMAIDFFAGLRYIQVKQEALAAENITLSPTAGAGQGGVTVTNDTGANPPPANTNGQNVISPTNPPGNGSLYPSTATLLGTFTASILDQIKVKNDFYLAQIGMSFDWQISPKFSFLGTGKLGFGGVRQTANLVGLQTTTFTPSGVTFVGDNNPTLGQPTGVTGGLLVAPQDNGREITTDRVVFVPEVNLSIGYQCTDSLRLLCGWNIIHFSTIAKVDNVTAQAQVTNQINFGEQSVNNTVVQPGFRFGGQKTNLQGITLGAEFSY